VIPPLPHYAFMAWCSVKKSTSTTLHLSFTWFEYRPGAGYGNRGFSQSCRRISGSTSAHHERFLLP